MAWGSRFKKLFDLAKKPFEKLVKKHNYDFYKDMMNNEIAKSSNPEKKALEWFKENYLNNPSKYKSGRRAPKVGSLITFNYYDPLTKDKLAFWDTNPLVLIIEPFINKDEVIRAQGINLHLLPPNIRKLVLYQAWYMYKESYTAQMFDNINSLQVHIEWQVIKNHLKKFSAGFAFRRYALSRMSNVLEFNQEDWAKAVWIPSTKYERKSFAEIEKLYQEYVKKNNSITGGESFKSSSK